MESITVIIPTCNRAALLAETLRALAEQSDPMFEVLLVDHGSMDDTRKIVESYKKHLTLRYYILDSEKGVLGAPKNFGVKKANTELIIFLDAGMIVSPTFICAHRVFHTAHNPAVGLGLNFGVEREDADWLCHLSSYGLEGAVTHWKMDPTVFDPRTGLELSKIPLPWVYAWGGNMSIHRTDFSRAGGFDPRHTGWGFEDLSLGYRLWKNDISFGFVEDGWAVHLPHPRTPLRERIKTEWRNWRITFEQKRTLALEAFGCALMDLASANEVYKRLTDLVKKDRDTPQPIHTAEQTFPRPSLLIGGTEYDLGMFDYVTLGNETFESTDSVWSCCGILIPLHGRSLESVVVAKFWQHLNFIPHPQAVSMIERLIIEIGRTARRAFFVGRLNSQEDDSLFSVSLDLLTHLCNKHGLPYELIGTD
ncbi:Validoxylamine A glucosyltransferase [Methylococcales bacterium]|nr:Validoxylamine A glucosyltransferase [Methylococcales bacterium]